MAETPDDIKRHIDSTRSDLGQNLQVLQTKVKHATDWRGYVERNPAILVGLAFTGGILGGALLGRARNGHPTNDFRPPPETFRAQTPHPSTDYQRSKAGDAWDTMKGAMIAWSAKQFRSLLSEALPGFHQAYEETHRQKMAGRSSYPHPEPD